MGLWAAFLVQVLLAIGALGASGWLSRRARWVWTAAGVVGTACILLWPLLRLFPTLPIRLLGAPLVSCVELTGLFIPAVLVLGIGARQAPRSGDRRAIGLLVCGCGIFFVRSGWWMVAGPLEDLGPMKMEGEICRQTTGYTCVAASMVTLLRARGIEATETEMARLAHIERHGGATDSRALWALEQKLASSGRGGGSGRGDGGAGAAGRSLEVTYSSMDLAAFVAAPKPCLVQLDWGYFVSHMVPVMRADEREVVIGDPLEGLRTMPTTEFAKQWKGQAIVVSEVKQGG